MVEEQTQSIVLSGSIRAANHRLSPMAEKKRVRKRKEKYQRGLLNWVLKNARFHLPEVVKGMGGRNGENIPCR